MTLWRRDYPHRRPSACDSGARRLDQPHDPLRLEIADGITDGAAILPILLENAQMPQAAELPADIRALADYNALRLRDGDWQHDLSNICRTLERAGFRPVAAPSEGSPHPQAQPQQNSSYAAPKGIGVKGIVAAVLVVLALAALGSDDLDRDGHIGAGILSVVGLALGILTWRENRYQRSSGRTAAIVISTLAALGVLAAIGGMDAAPPATGSVPSPNLIGNAPLTW